MTPTRSATFDFDAVNRSLGERGIVPAAAEDGALAQADPVALHRVRRRRVRQVAVAAVGLLAAGMAVNAARGSRRFHRFLSRLPKGIEIRV